MKKLLYDGEQEERLDKILSRFFSSETIDKSEQISRSQVKILIESGAIFVSGKIANKAGFLVKPCEEIEIGSIPARTDFLDAYDFKLEIIYEDEYLLVVNKPPYLSMHPGAGNKTTTLVNALIHHYKNSNDAQFFSETQRPGIVHRLDKDTSGLVVIAKNSSCHHALADQFSKHTVGREYSTLVYTTPRYQREVGREDKGRIETFLGRHGQNRLKIAVLNDKGKKAATNWQVAERLGYGCLVKVRLETGRTHQIRVHMDHLGSPVIGDKLYGDFSGLPKPLQVAASELGRQALHAGLLEFQHPGTKKRVSFSAELPADFKKLLAVFRDFKI